MSRRRTGRHANRYQIAGRRCYKRPHGTAGPARRERTRCAARRAVLVRHSGALERLPAFYRRCGSSYVVYHQPDQLPADQHDEACLFAAFGNHRLARETAHAHGITLARLPFPAAIYLLETGTNMSLAHPRIARWTARTRERVAQLGRRIVPRRSVPEAVRCEFALSVGA